MRHYCTLFDSKYLPQGLALYESLKNHSSERFALWVLAMDKECETVLREMQLPCTRIVDREWFERQAQFAIKPAQTWQEYCWACASVFTDHLMRICESDEYETFEAFTYIDADCYFFSSPEVIFDEIADRSIAVIPHRLAENDQKERLSKNGQFNVSLVHFKNTPVGRECLSTWAAQVRERCSAEVGCGDQKYLDAWPAKYGDELAVIQNIGAGVAPWNLANYTLTEGPKVDGKDVVFYHYHELKRVESGFRWTNYQLRDQDVELIYLPYKNAYLRAEQQIASIHLPA